MSLVEILLFLTKSVAVSIFCRKIAMSLCVAIASHIFSAKKNAEFWDYIMFENFNVLLTNDMIIFEQLGPAVLLI